MYISAIKSKILRKFNEHYSTEVRILNNLKSRNRIGIRNELNIRIRIRNNLKSKDRIRILYAWQVGSGYDLISIGSELLGILHMIVSAATQF